MGVTVGVLVAVGVGVIVGVLVAVGVGVTVGVLVVVGEGLFVGEGVKESVAAGKEVAVGGISPVIFDTFAVVGAGAPQALRNNANKMRSNSCRQHIMFERLIFRNE